MTTIEFTQDLAVLQGLLNTVDSKCSFKNLSAKGGNEKDIDLVIGTIRDFLYSKNYLNDKGIVKDAENTMRIFAFYIILNSDLEVLNELSSSTSAIVPFISTVATIPKYLMCEMLWKLSMGKFVEEIITYSYPQLAIEVADALISTVKYMDPTECLPQLHMLTTTCFNIICRIQLFDFKDSLLKSAFSNFERCMAYFIDTPNPSKLSQLSMDDFYKYYGNCLYTMISTFWDCFTQYNATQTCNFDDYMVLYEATHINKYSGKTNYKPCECTDEAIVDIFDCCFVNLLDKCATQVMGVDLDMFCAWSEFEECGVTMQQSIGELCLKLRKELVNTRFSVHPVVKMLEQISRNPVKIKDKINNMESSEIIENIEQHDKDSKKWLHALLHKNNLTFDLKLLQMLNSNTDQFNEDVAYDFFKKLYLSHNNACIEIKQIIQTLRIKFFKRCSTALKHDITDNHFKNSNFNDEMECSDFDRMLTEIFNKLTNTPDSDVEDVLNVFLQNPRQVYVTIFKSAIENEHQSNLMYEVMICLSKYANHYYIEETEPSLTIVLRKSLEQDLNTGVKQKNFTNFISKLKNADILSTSKLLLLIIMPQLHTALIHKNYGNIHVLCDLLHKCYSVQDLLEYRTPMLAMLAQVMTQVRWKINTFDFLSPCILQLVIDLQKSLMNSYFGSIPENEVSWLKSKLKSLDPLDMYYYRQLWNPPGNTFVEVVSGIHIHLDMDIEKLTLWLSRVLCSSTLQEWECIWENFKDFGDPKTLDLFHNAMMSVFQAERANRTHITWACVMYCFKNLFHCIRYKFFKEPLSNSQVSNVTTKLLSIVSCIQEEKADEFGRILMPLFSYIVERKADYNFSISESVACTLPECKLRFLINHLLGK